MCGFAGIVNYSADFLTEIPCVTKWLWKMAENLKWGTRHGIDVIEPHGAFVQNSCKPLCGSDYCFRHGEELGYLFCSRYSDEPLSGACFIPAEKKLLLFRKKDGPPVYYEDIEGTGLVFSSSESIPKLFDNHKMHKVLEPDKSFVYES